MAPQLSPRPRVATTQSKHLLSDPKLRPDRLKQRFKTLCHGSGDQKHGASAGLFQTLNQISAIVFIDQLELVEHQQTGALREALAIGLELLLHHLEIADRILRTAIYHVDQQARSLDVAKEVMAETCPLGSTSNESRDIGKHGSIAGRPAHNSQIGDQGGEGVVGDLGPGC